MLIIWVIQGGLPPTAAGQRGPVVPKRHCPTTSVRPSLLSFESLPANTDVLNPPGFSLNRTTSTVHVDTLCRYPGTWVIGYIPSHTAMDSDTTTIGSLPPELLLSVLSWTDPKTLLTAVGRVCWAWRAAAEEVRGIHLSESTWASSDPTPGSGARSATL